MSSALIPENHIVVPTSLAATIGLEEAVMLQIMSDCLKYRPLESAGGFDWVQLPKYEALALMPFWTEEDLDRISRRLQSLGVIRLDNATLMLTNQLVFALNEPSERAETSAPQATPVTQPEAPRQAASQTAQATPPRGASTMREGWQPNSQLLRKLDEFHGIAPEFALQLVPEFVVYWRDRQSSTFSWEARFMSHALRQWQQAKTSDKPEPAQEQERFQVGARGETTMYDQWQPGEDALGILVRSGIDEQFILQAVPEFILYWRDRGDITSTWDSRFIGHIRRQWARYESSMEYDTDPKRIESDWQPSEDVYDVLQLANIDIEFARATVKEFVVYWRDTNQVYNSWNSRFLQHVKTQWARRHQWEQHGQGHGKTAQSTTEQDRRSFVDKHTDQSWREGL